MDRIRQQISSTLPTLSAKTLSDLIALLEELGVELYSDLKLVEERDLVKLLKPIQRRKLLKTWKETTFVDMTENQINKFGSRPVLAIPIEPATTRFENPAFHKKETQRNMLLTAVKKAAGKSKETTSDLFLDHYNEHSSNPTLNQTTKPTSNYVSGHNINLLITGKTNNDSSELFKQTERATLTAIADETESGMEASSNQIASISSSINDDEERVYNIEGLTESSSLLVVRDRSAWAEDFVVPWQQLSADLRELLEQGEQLVPHDRRLLVQVICSCIKKVCIKPTKKDLDTIAKKMVSEYPYSLSDNTVGTGFTSISNQMLNRITNTNRKLRNRGQMGLIVHDFSRGHERISPNMKRITRSNTSMIEMIPRNDTLLIKTPPRNDSSKTETPPTKKYCADQGRDRTRMLRKVIEITMEDKQCNWAETFVIPWHELPIHLQDTLETGKRPIHSDRLLLIREICQFIQEFVRIPRLMSNLKIIAKRMVYKYPDSLCDIIGGKVVGNGYTSILNQLMCRIENLKRGTGKRNMRRGLNNEEHSKQNIRKKHKGHVQHSDKNITMKATILPKVENHTDWHGCVEFAPRLPEGESVKSQRQKQEDMKAIFSIGYKNLDSNIAKMLRDTYSSQRLYINKGSTIQELIKEWPWLFTEGGFLAHFKFLVGVDIVMKFNEATISSVSQIVNYMKLRNIGCADKLRMEAVLQEIREWSDYEEKSSNFAAAIFLLMAYFGEDSSTLFLKVDKASTTREVELMDELPKTPCLVICDKDTCSGNSFMLAVDKVVVNKDITTFEGGVAMVFASYYCLNIRYPIAAGATLEFIQRCFLRIHPNKGTKVSLGYKSKARRVFSLINRLQSL